MTSNFPVIAAVEALTSLTPGERRLIQQELERHFRGVHSDQLAVYRLDDGEALVAPKDPRLIAGIAVVATGVAGFRFQQTTEGILSRIKFATALEPFELPVSSSEVRKRERRPFSSRSRRLLGGAETKEAALRAGGTDLLLERLAAEVASREAVLLTEFGFDAAKVKDLDAERPTAVKRALDRAERYALALGRQSVEPEHILLALLDDRSCRAAQALTKASISLDELRDRLIQDLGS